MKTEKGKPPKNAKRVYAWRDLPFPETAAVFTIQEDGGAKRKFSAKDKRRRAIEGLMTHPIYSASYARISDQVWLLKAEGVDIEIIMYRNDPETREGLRQRSSRASGPPDSTGHTSGRRWFWGCRACLAYAWWGGAILPPAG